LVVGNQEFGEVDVAAVVAEARRVLAGNRQRGVSEWEGRRYDFVCPSPGTYPFQWFWDSAFHAVALLHIDPALAKQELRCLLQSARPDGFIPHMTLWERRYHDAALAEYNIVLADEYHTATVQPPVLARAIEREGEVGILVNASTVERLTPVALNQLLNVGVAGYFAKAEVPAANGFIERFLAGYHKGGGRDESEAAFGKRLFRRRPGDRVNFPPRISFQEQLDRKREFVEIAHLPRIAGVPADCQVPSRGYSIQPLDGPDLVEQPFWV